MYKIKVLAVDDEEDTLKMMRSTFHNHDLTIETNSLKAIKIIGKEKFDVFIIDYQMPNLNGIEILEEVKEMNNKNPHVSILCLPIGTVHIFKEELISGLFDFLLEKPYEDQTLKEIMKKAIDKLRRLKGTL